MTSFTEIGKGTFGIIFTDVTQYPGVREDTACILKRTIQPNVDPRKWLQQDAFHHEAIATALAKVSTDRHLKDLSLPYIPRFYGLIAPEYSWWSLCGNAHPGITKSKVHSSNVYSQPSLLLSAQRIPSVNTTIARGVLNKYRQQKSQGADTDSALSDDASILLRRYFGQNTPAETNSDLQNFPLYRNRLQSVLSKIDQVKALQVLASALAFLHWYVHCDAKDVEFVFGGLNPLAEGEYPTFELFGEKCHMWLLDFNQVETITMDLQGVEKAVLGYENDPYYPKPGKDIEDWMIFKCAYINASQKLLRADEDKILPEILAEAVPSDLPLLFIAKVEKFSGLNRGQRALDFATVDNAGPKMMFLSLWAWLRQLLRW